MQLCYRRSRYFLSGNPILQHDRAAMVVGAIMMMMMFVIRIHNKQVRNVEWERGERERRKLMLYEPERESVAIKYNAASNFFLSNTNP